MGDNLVLRGFDREQRFCPPKNPHYVEEAGRDGPSGQGRAERLGDLPQLDLLSGSKLPQERFQGWRVPSRNIGQAATDTRQQRQGVGGQKFPRFFIRNRRAIREIKY